MGLTEWIAIIGAVTGVTGTVLGIVTTIDMLRKNRVKLRVIPRLAWANNKGICVTSDRWLHECDLERAGRPPNRMAIEIVNLSAFPVVISEVGLGRPDSNDRMVLIVPETSPGFTWPPTLESRRAVTVYQLLQGITERSPVAWPRIAYVETQCGAVAYGRSAALDWLTDHLRQQRPSQALPDPCPSSCGTNEQAVARSNEARVQGEADRPTKSNVPGQDEQADQTS